MSRSDTFRRRLFITAVAGLATLAIGAGIYRHENEGRQSDKQIVPAD